MLYTLETPNSHQMYLTGKKVDFAYLILCNQLAFGVWICDALSDYHTGFYFNICKIDSVVANT